MKLFAKSSALILSAALAAALLAGCGAASSQAASSAAASSVAASSVAASSVAASSEAASSEAASAAAIEVTFSVTGEDGAVASMPLAAYEGESLGDALLREGVISQEEHDAGFVTTVLGVAADYNADKAWWALVDANGEMTPVGIADIQLADGDSYGFVYTVG